MAVANANYEFIYGDVGANGRVSDGGVWGNCSLSKSLEENKAGISGPEKLNNSNKHLPFVFVGDDAFPMKNYLLKPFPLRNQNEEHLLVQTVQGQGE